MGYTPLSNTLASLSMLFLFRASTHNFLRNWTGEEGFKEQVEGLGTLLLIRLALNPRSHASHSHCASSLILQPL